MSLFPTPDKSSHLIKQASRSADQIVRATQHAANGAMDSVRDTSRQLRVKAEHASDTTVNYIKEEPVKAVLFAAATGAALMALVSLASLMSAGWRRLAHRP